MGLPAALSGLLSLGDVSVFADIPKADLGRLEPQLGVVRWLQGTAIPDQLVAEQHLFIVREGCRRMIAWCRTVSYYSSPGLLQNRYPFGPFQVRRFSTIQV